MPLSSPDLDPLCALGYTAVEAEWLHRVMTHAGTFLRRQFVTYRSATKSGGHDQRLIAKLLRLRHAITVPYHQRERLYHLRARRLYAAIGREHSRLRRSLPPLASSQGLLVLDLLALEPRTYLESEDEKVEYFVRRLGMSRNQLPHRVYRSTRDPKTATTTHYFVERYPIATDVDGTVRFVVPDLAPHSAASLRAFLVDYGPLLQAVPRAEIVYVTGRQESAQLAERLYHDACSPPATDLDLTHIETLHTYFATRRALDQHAYGSLSKAALDRYQDDARRFAGPAYTDLYDHWLRGGVVALTRALQARPLTTRHLAFRHVALPWRYYCLGLPLQLAARRATSRRTIS